MKVKGCTCGEYFNLKFKQNSRTTKIGCSIWSNIASKCWYENTTLTLSKRHFRDLWKNFVNILQVSMLLFRSRCQSLINLQSMLPQWENNFNLRKYMYQVPARLVLSLVVQCTVYSVWQEQLVKAIVSSLQRAKPRNSDHMPAV